MAFRPRPSLTIAVEGPRTFSPEKLEAFGAYSRVALAEARPKAVVRPGSVFISEGRISNRTEVRDEYGEPTARRLRLQAAAAGSHDGSGRSSSNSSDSRFSEGTTTHSSYKGLSNR
jgi:hypothetical protein